MAISVSTLASSLGGQALYQENCAACHGKSAKGGIGPRLVGDATTWKPALFERAVLTGIDDDGKALKPPMPRWKDSSFKSDKGVAPRVAEIDAIQHYLQTLK